MFISYAQNFEDVMLWRALKHIEHGFYIDVGANDPSIDSVTRAFYERGWHGINIEPLSTHFADLQRERPRDINLRCAVGPSKGEVEIWECDIRGWASLDKVAIERHTAMGYNGRYHQVQMATLAEICEQNAPHEIHFLKIDVEGFERSVLEGMDFQRFRPWIVVVEATRPNSTEEVHDQWEDLLLGVNYSFVYADGLNRFYLAREREELVGALKYPPNVFDGYVLASQIEAEAKAQQAEAKAQQAEAKAQQAEAKAQQAEAKAQKAEAKAQQAEAKVQQAEAKVQQAEAKVQQAEAKVQQAEATIIIIHNSSSWRITQPLRWAVKKNREITQQAFMRGLLFLPKQLAKRILLLVLAFINRHPKFRQYTLTMFKRFGLYGVARTLYTSVIYNAGAKRSCTVIPTDIAHLSPRARAIYSDLKAAIQNHNEGAN